MIEFLLDSVIRLCTVATSMPGADLFSVRGTRAPGNVWFWNWGQEIYRMRLEDLVGSGSKKVPKWWTPQNNKSMWKEHRNLSKELPKTKVGTIWAAKELKSYWIITQNIKINSHVSRWIEVNDWTNKWVGQNRQVSCATEFQIVYVDTQPSRMWNINTHFLNTDCTLWLLSRRVQHGRWDKRVTSQVASLESSAAKESVSSAGDPSLICESGRSPGEGMGYPLQYSWASLVAQLVKNLPAVQEPWVQSLGWGDPREEGMATHPSILAWRIPWTL